MISLSTSLLHYESPKAGTPAGDGTHPVQWDEYGTRGTFVFPAGGMFGKLSTTCKDQGMQFAGLQLTR